MLTPPLVERYGPYFPGPTYSHTLKPFNPQNRYMSDLAKPPTKEEKEAAKAAKAKAKAAAIKS